jgi:hypothetical protein
VYYFVYDGRTSLSSGFCLERRTNRGSQLCFMQRTRPGQEGRRDQSKQCQNLANNQPRSEIATSSINAKIRHHAATISMGKTNQRPTSCVAVQVWRMTLLVTHLFLFPHRKARVSSNDRTENPVLPPTHFVSIIASDMPLAHRVYVFSKHANSELTA